MLSQGSRTLLTAVLAIGLMVVGFRSSIDPSLAVPSSQVSSSAYQELVFPVTSSFGG